MLHKSIILFIFNLLLTICYANNFNLNKSFRSGNFVLQQIVGNTRTGVNYIMEKEKWQIINEYPNYKISNLGVVINIKTNTKVAICMHQHGHHVVRLWKNNTTKLFKIYRLLAIHFIPNPEHKPCVNHLDGNRLNYTLSNLEWVTYSENMIHAYKNGLADGYFRKGFEHSHCKMTPEKLDYIFQLRGQKKTLIQIAELTGFHWNYISKVLNGGVYGKIFTK